MPSTKRPLYSGEFTWWLNDQGPTKLRKTKADMLRENSASYRQRIKIDYENLMANAETEMLTAARER